MRACFQQQETGNGFQKGIRPQTTRVSYLCGLSISVTAYTCCACKSTHAHQCPIPQKLTTNVNYACKKRKVWVCCNCRQLPTELSRYCQSSRRRPWPTSCGHLLRCPTTQVSLAVALPYPCFGILHWPVSGLTSVHCRVQAAMWSSLCQPMILQKAVLTDWQGSVWNCRLCIVEWGDF